ncbi:MAG TPA: FAD-binding oxidoreductase [Candidatus Peribacteraceae bacterium]|nr:FAD-binding oxidoreductase [Candidatus Peribacteraceae bacterium]
MSSFDAKKQRLIDEMKAAEGGVSLGKDTSNLFRDRKGAAQKKLNVRDFHDVIGMNAEEQWVEVEGMTPYSELVDWLLPHGFMPAVVPQLKSITIGGAVVGVGIEATSFRYGLVHETILEMEVLLPGGRVVVCTPTNEHKDLFYGLPNSYGTLGYILKLKAKIIPVKKYVRVTHEKFDDSAKFFNALEEACHTARKEGIADFIDGVIFSDREMVLSRGRFTDEAPYAHDYTYMHIYYRTLQKRKEDYLTTRDYIWRWDTDWFWCSKTFLVQNPIVRFFVGRKRLNSVTYTKIMRWSARTGFGERLTKWRGVHAESVIQDLAMPIESCVEFLTFLLREIRVLPIWVCPSMPADATAEYPLFHLDHTKLYVDFGFWDVVHTKEKHPAGFFNRKVEVEVEKLGGIKSLYSESFFPKEEFWKIYNKAQYDRLKKEYDPEGKLRDLYDKCVLKA